MKYESCSSCLLQSKATKNLDETGLQILGKNCTQTIFEKGETIVKQNTLSSSIIYLKSGLVKIMADGPQRKQILKIKKAPIYLGLPTTMGDRVNNYSIAALQKSMVCFVEIDIFKELLANNPEFSYEIIMELCKNELLQNNRFVKLMQNQIFGRLATNLLFFANKIYESDEFDLPLNRSELADLICSSRESVSRLLTELTQENTISIKGKRLRIINKERLAEISLKG